jgi:ribosomal protein S18 acetylase RimI-like enzyme
MNADRSQWIKLNETLAEKDCRQIEALRERCVRAEPVALKLELDYKRSAALAEPMEKVIRNVNEFLYFEGRKLAGYLGICSFGGPGMPLEATGMVDPEERRKGIFTALYRLALAEARRRGTACMLLLCDRSSVSGQRFLRKAGAVCHHSEYEMVLKREWSFPGDAELRGVTLRKAVNADAREIAGQDALYFSDEGLDAKADFNANAEGPDAAQKEILLPEKEEKEGLTVWLAEKDGRPVGKVNLELGSGIGGIYGLGVRPEFRGKGFGRSILLQAVGKLKTANAAEVMLQVATDNTKALNLYTSCGFQETSVMDYDRVDF